jgi:hypothetical protein
VTVEPMNDWFFYRRQGAIITTYRVEWTRLWWVPECVQGLSARPECVVLSICPGLM